MRFFKGFVLLCCVSSLVACAGMWPAPGGAGEVRSPQVTASIGSKGATFGISGLPYWVIGIVVVGSGVVRRQWNRYVSGEDTHR